MPVGSSATSMTHVPPRTGKHYIVISAGDTACSPERGDDVLAFALP